MDKSAGFTFIELMVAVAVLGVITAVAAPSFLSLQTNLESRRALIEVGSVLAQARSTAYVNHVDVVVCATNNRVGCSRKRGTELMAFKDFNQDKKRQANEGLLGVVPASYQWGYLQVRPGGNRSHFTFKSDSGMPRGSQGNITYCSKAGGASASRSLILSMQGRIRNSFDWNGDGVHDKRSRKDPVKC